MTTPQPPEGYRIATPDEVRESKEAALVINTIPGSGTGWIPSMRGCEVDSDYVFYALPNNPSTDPKASSGAAKPQVQLLPPALSTETAKALACGAAKYGAWNWREHPVEVMTYLGAMKRHIDAYLNGEDMDPESGASHLGHVAAGCGIVLDAQYFGTLIDNRPPKKPTP